MKKELEEIKHSNSAKQYPDIKLEKDEYVVLAIERTNIGIIGIWCAVGGLILLLCVVLIALFSSGFPDNTILTFNDQMRSALTVGIIALFVAIILAGFAGHYIYSSNRMYVTNMRAIQKIQNSLFSNSTNIIDLKKIEDVSFKQSTLVDHIFHFGTLRMSTVGDETTYTFPLLDTPKDEVDTISHLIHERKACSPDA